MMKSQGASDQQAEVIQSTVFGNRLHILVQDADTARQAIEKTLATHSQLVGDAHPIPISLEDMFMALIQQEDAGSARHLDRSQT